MRKDGFDSAEALLVYTGLKSRWSDKIEPGWYGFDLTLWPPVNWYNAINAFLTWLETQQPEFKIRQIKLKFGRLHIYVTYPVENEELRKDIFEFSQQFFDQKLVY